MTISATAAIDPMRSIMAPAQTQGAGATEPAADAFFALLSMLTIPSSEGEGAGEQECDARNNKDGGESSAEESNGESAETGVPTNVLALPPGFLPLRMPEQTAHPHTEAQGGQAQAMEGTGTGMPAAAERNAAAPVQTQPARGEQHNITAFLARFRNAGSDAPARHALPGQVSALAQSAGQAPRVESLESPHAEGDRQANQQPAAAKQADDHKKHGEETASGATSQVRELQISSEAASEAAPVIRAADTPQTTGPRYADQSANVTSTDVAQVAEAAPARKIELPTKPVVGEISVRIDSDEPVKLLFRERQGEVTIDVRTRDRETAISLQSQLDTLSHRLDEAGYHAEISAPERTTKIGQSELLQEQNGSQDQPGGRDHSDPRQGHEGRRQQDQNRRRNAGAFEQEEDFSWLLRSRD